MDEYVGTGPGAITNDGCAVEFYARLPAFGEAEIVHAAVPPGASVLELGCGAGRILRPLAALGHPVTGVDDCPAMLDRRPDLPTICAPVQSLRLDRAFDVVLLASTLINADPGTRRRAEIEYQADGNVWTHAWTSYRIGDEELARDLASAGLRLGDWLTADRAWFTARPA
jgi:SAM-dependent methyltransferase